MKVAGVMSEWFVWGVGGGIRQACILLPYLFNFLDEIARKKIPEGFRGGI